MTSTPHSEIGPHDAASDASAEGRGKKLAWIIHEHFCLISSATSSLDYS